MPMMMEEYMPMMDEPRMDEPAFAYIKEEEIAEEDVKIDRELNMPM